MAAYYFYSFSDAFRKVMEFIDFYSNERIHGALKCPPAEFKEGFENNLYPGYEVSA